MDASISLDAYLPETIRTKIEQTYYARVSACARLEALIQDTDFLNDPTRHVAFFADHGVVHVRNIAQQVLDVLDRINGVLIPRRDTSRLEMMRAYGVMVTYLHDIGMCDFSPFGRAMHPEFAAQVVFAPTFAPLVTTIWEKNCGDLADHLQALAVHLSLAYDPRLILHEMLAMSMCHSKTKVPVETLNTLHRLQTLMQSSVSTDLQVLYRLQQKEKADNRLAQARQAHLSQADMMPFIIAFEEAQDELTAAQNATRATGSRHLCAWERYPDFQRDAFSWLVCDHPVVCRMRSDVIDTLRALRCADALRQRGTMLRTSASYQIFVDQRTANAIHALHADTSGQMFLLETSDAISAGEANLASCELTPEGDVRLSFNCGAFASPEAVQHAVHSAAIVITDIQADVLGSFRRSSTLPSAANCAAKSAHEMHIFVEEVDDNPDFARLVCTEVIRLNPHLNSRCRPVPSLQPIVARGRKAHQREAALNWGLEQRRSLLRKMSQTGHKVSHIDPVLAFRDVTQIDLATGEVLIEAGSSPEAAYLPLGSGLIGSPLGGYAPFPVPPWAPLGNTGVICGAPRNATVVAQKPLRVLRIPKQIFLQYWHSTYTLEEFRRQLAAQIGAESTSTAVSGDEAAVICVTGIVT